ncbi:pseudouridine synthase [Galbibacter sp. PAP.153]|uniref:pseudouridine synthase n=1 Tax=Galbibacter sp. PAP.153 TaxID=3104623 RepID=UPI0030099BC4
MSRQDRSKKGKSHGRQGGGSKKFSGRQGGHVKKQSQARGNAPVKNTHSNKKSQLAPNEVRLNKYIANSGICSRRDADIYIASGNVTVNGEVIIEMGYKVKLTDEVKFDGRAIKPEKKEYVLLNKPKGFIASNDRNLKKNASELIVHASKSRLSPVVKFDRTTTGLLLYTNDDELAQKLSSINNVRKIYHVVLDKNFKNDDLIQVRQGLVVDGATVKVEDISPIEGGNKNEVGIKIYSGINNIVKKIFANLGYEIVKMDCVSYAGLTKKDISRGNWRHLTKQEIINLQML